MAMTAEPGTMTQATAGPTIAKGCDNHAAGQPLRPMQFDRSHGL
jgi:hypothetical protein